MPRCKNCRKPFKPRFSTFEKFCWDVQCKTLEGLQKVQERKDMEAKKQRKELKKLATSKDLRKICQRNKKNIDPRPPKNYKKHAEDLREI